MTRSVRQNKQMQMYMYASGVISSLLAGAKCCAKKVDKIGNKVVRMHTKSHVYDVDFRKSLVAKFHRGVQIEMSDK